MLHLDDMRREFAYQLFAQPEAGYSMDKALAHVVMMAYEAGLRDGAAKVGAGETAALSMAEVARLARYEDMVNLVDELHDSNMALLQAIRRTLDDNAEIRGGEAVPLD